jgi:hypothetical protein
MQIASGASIAEEAIASQKSAHCERVEIPLGAVPCKV